jgi:hypothetical protein
LVTTRDRIIESLHASARTPLDLIRQLETEQPRVRDVRSTLLRLIADEVVDFDVDGKLRLPQKSQVQSTAATA